MPTSSCSRLKEADSDSSGASCRRSRNNLKTRSLVSLSYFEAMTHSPQSCERRVSTKVRAIPSITMWSKKYNGYRSLQYLEAGVDYQDYELVPEINRVSNSTQVATTPEQEQRVEVI